MWNIVFYTSPIIIAFFYCRGYFVAKSISNVVRVTAGIGIIVFISLCIRGIGRSKSVDYIKFVKVLDAAKANVTNQNAKEHLRMFDFEFSGWPVDFNVKDVSRYNSMRRTFIMMSSEITCLFCFIQFNLTETSTKARTSF